MKRLACAALCCAFLSSIPSAAASQPTPKFGLGIGFSSAGFGVVDIDDLFSAVLAPASVYLAYTTSVYRIEPEIGLARVSGSVGNTEFSATLFQLGLGVLALRPVGVTSTYLGGRVGFARRSTSTESPGSSAESSATDLYLGPVAGAEHLFNRLSLGGEVQLLYTTFGDDDDAVDESASLLRTRAVLFIRWYF